MQDPRVRPLRCNQEHVQSCLKKNIGCVHRHPRLAPPRGEGKDSQLARGAVRLSSSHATCTSLSRTHCSCLTKNDPGCQCHGDIPHPTTPGHWDGKRAARSVLTTCSSQTSLLWACIKEDAPVYPARIFVNSCCRHCLEF